MKFRGKKIFKVGKIRAMIAGGISRMGKPHMYGGVKTKKGLSAGVSVGTEGKQIYASANKGRGHVRVKHNLTSGITQLRLKKKKAHY